jgi:aspartate/methionine/tyrosine aminotransferase
MAESLALDGGMLVSPGDLYGDAGAGHVRIAVVQPMERLALVGARLGAASSAAAGAGLGGPRAPG